MAWPDERLKKSNFGYKTVNSRIENPAIQILIILSVHFSSRQQNLDWMTY